MNIPELTLLATLMAIGWITTSICFDRSLYWTPGLFIFFGVLYFGTKELRASKINELAFDFSDDDKVVSLNLVKKL